VDPGGRPSAREIADAQQVARMAKAAYLKEGTASKAANSAAEEAGAPPAEDSESLDEHSEKALSRDDEIPAKATESLSKETNFDKARKLVERQAKAAVKKVGRQTL
jgi:hypothetical protein